MIADEGDDDDSCVCVCGNMIFEMGQVESGVHEKSVREEIGQGDNHS